MERTEVISAVPEASFFFRDIKVAAMEVTPGGYRVLIQGFLTTSVMQLREVIVIPFRMSQMQYRLFINGIKQLRSSRSIF